MLILEVLTSGGVLKHAMTDWFITFNSSGLVTSIKESSYGITLAAGDTITIYSYDRKSPGLSGYIVAEYVHA